MTWTTDLTGVFLLRYSIDVIGKNDYFYLERFIYIQIYYIFARLHTDTHTHTHTWHAYIHIYIHTYTFTWYFVYSDGNQIDFVIGKLFFKKVNLRVSYHGWSWDRWSSWPWDSFWQRWYLSMDRSWYKKKKN